MEKSKVYFTDLRIKPGLNLLKKLNNLIIKAGIKQIEFEKKIVAVKIHFGEPGNLAYLRPNFAAHIVKFLKAEKALPFLTDCNTLYHGKRANAPEHLEAAFEHGYNPLVTGCPVIIADGIRGGEYREVELNLELTRSAKIGSAIADSDIIISMNHFKGHELTGFGGALKNLGMGCASVGGKLYLHSGTSPVITEENCTGCKMCEIYCAHDAIKVGSDKIARIDYEKCVGCGQCVAVCQYNAAGFVLNHSSELACRRISEYALAVVRDKPSFHINFILDVSPDCDCWDANDVPIVPDIGMAASFDPVALDKASADMVTSSPGLRGSKILGKRSDGDLSGMDKFRMTHPDTHWQSGIEHAVKIGLGNADYELIHV